MMENKKTNFKKAVKKKKVNLGYIDVDLYQTYFSRHSENAVFDIYAKKHGMSTNDVKMESFRKSNGDRIPNHKHKTFQYCLAFLRREAEKQQ